MRYFELGPVSLVVAVLFPTLYFVGLQFRRLSTWSKREQGPKDRIGFFLLIFAIVGFGVGSFAQPVWDEGVKCKSTGQPLAPCLLFQLK